MTIFANEIQRIFVKVFVLRKKLPNAERPYQVIGYPILPAAYIVMAFIICISLLIFKTAFAMSLK